MTPPTGLQLSVGPIRVAPDGLERLAKGDILIFKWRCVFGDFRLEYGDAAIDIPNCPVLAASEAFVRVSSFPVLYGIDAYQSVEDEYIDIRSTFDGRELTIDVSSHRPRIEIRGDPVSLMRICGNFHREVLRGLSVTVPGLRKYGYALTQITDAFALVPALNDPEP